MSTKVIIVGKESRIIEKKRPIQLFYFWNKPSEIKENVCGEIRPETQAHEYPFVELIAKSYFAGYDLIFCYLSPDLRGKGCLYIGRWNDGVV